MSKQLPSELTPQQRGAMITNSGKSPIASLPEDKRKELLNHVILRAMQDMKLKDVAAELGVARTSLNQALLKYCEDDWKEAQVARSLVNIEDAEEELETATTLAAVSRASVRLKSAQWHLEKLHRRLFGQEAPHSMGSGTVHIHIGINRSPVGSQVIDAERVVPDCPSGRGE